MIEQTGKTIAPRAAHKRLLMAAAFLSLLCGMSSATSAQQTNNSDGQTTPAPITAQQATAEEVRSPTPSTDKLYRIGPGDTLEIRVFKMPDLSAITSVDNRGMIRLPKLDGEISAACRTEVELGREIETLYMKYLRTPSVTVYIKEYNSQPVSVVGSVIRPGPFQLRRPMRLLDLLSVAGGKTDAAGKDVHVIHTPGSFRCVERNLTVVTADDISQIIDSYNLASTLRGEDESNPYVSPGDTVTVPEARRVFTVGNVNRPTAIPIRDEPITVTRAIAESSGLAVDTKKSALKIIRRNPNGGPNLEIAVNLDAINNRQAEDVTLQAGDILEVPASRSRQLVRGIFGSLIPSLVTAPVNRLP